MLLKPILIFWSFGCFWNASTFVLIPTTPTFFSSASPNGDHIYPSYLVIKRQQPYYSMSFYLLFNMCSLPNLLLNPSCAL